MPSETFLSRLHHFREGGLTVVLVVEAVFIFLVVPLGTLFPLLNILLSSVVVLVMSCAIIILSTNRAVTSVIVTVIVLGLVASLASEHVHSLQAACLDAGANLMTVISLSWLVAKNVFGPGRVTAHRIRGAVVLYLNVALGFAVVYQLTAALFPGAFSGVSSGTSRAGLRANFIYFSLTILTTTGLGDVAPIQPFMRSLANLESVFGALYPATLLARIVTLAMRDERPER